MADDTTQNLPTQILDNLRARLGARWDSISEADRQLFAACAVDAAALEAQSAAGASGEAIERELRHVRAQLAGIASIGAVEAQAVAGDFWKSVGDFASGALGVLLKAAL